jgi:hypothetical protein
MGAAYDRLLLRELARRSGGLFRTIMPGDEVEFEAFRLALALESPLVPAPEIRFSGAQVSDLYPPNADTLVAGQEMFVLGRYAAAGELKATIAAGDKPLADGRFNLPETCSANIFIPRVWARERLDALMLAQQTQEIARQIIDLSQEFTLMTPYTSFLVLENEAAYAQYGIVRAKRRRYWEELGKLRSAPPPEELRAQVPRQPRVEPEPEMPWVPTSFEPDAAQSQPVAVRCADMDLGVLNTRCEGGREIATALGALCFEVYYRYWPLNGGGSSGSSGWFTSRTGRTGFRSDDPFTTVPQEVLRRLESNSPAEPAGGGGTGGVDLNVADWFKNKPTSRTTLANVSLQDVIGVGGTGTGGGWGGGNGTGIGVDEGAGRASFGARNGGGRRLMVKRHGGSRASESSVDLTLTWLAAHQEADGHWSGNGLESTALPLLAFLGAGHTEKVGQFKDNVRKAVAWFAAQQKDNGAIGKDTFEQAWATTALSEASGMGNIPETKAAAQKAVEQLIRLQVQRNTQRLGWGNREQSDPFITCCAVMALKSAKVAGLKVDHEAFEGVIAYLDRAEAGIGSDRDLAPLHTASIALARQFLGYKKEDLEGYAESLGQVLSGKHESSPSAFYLRYFKTLVLFQQGGDLWKEWNEYLKKTVLQAQNREGELKGSWDPAGIYVLDRPIARKPLPPDEARAEIQKALDQLGKDVNAAARLADALSGCADVGVLQEVLGKYEGAAGEPRALVRMRLGVLHYENKRYAEAAEEFKVGYDLTGRSANTLEYWADALWQAGKLPEALATLMGDAKTTFADERLCCMLGYLLINPASGVADPAAFLNERLEKGRQRAEVQLAIARVAISQSQTKLGATLAAQAYADTDRSDHFIVPYVRALVADQRAREAFDLLLDEYLSEKRLSQRRVQLLADLVALNSTQGEQFAQQLVQRLADDRELRLKIWAYAAGKAEKRHDEKWAVALFKRACEEANWREACVFQYVRLLRAANMNKDAFDFLVRGFCQENRTEEWRIQAFTDLLLTAPEYSQAPETVLAGALKERPDIQAIVGLELGQRFLAQQKPEIAQRLLERYFVAGGRPEPLIQPYIESLSAAGQPLAAAGELEKVIQAGYHTPWAFNMLRSTYENLHYDGNAVLRAITCEVELFPREIQPHQALAAYYEKTGNPIAALSESRELLRIQPQAPEAHRAVFERAVALGRFDIARSVMKQATERHMNASWVLEFSIANLSEALKAGIAKKDPDAVALHKEIREAAARDLVVVINWDTNADIDLHVKEPNGQECHYQKMRTSNGGTLDRDARGPGQETYSIRTAPKGTYQVDVHYYGGAPTTKVRVIKYRHRFTDQETATTEWVELQPKEQKTAAKIVLR